MQYGFGVDLGGTTVKIAFFDIAGTMLCKWEIPTRRENNGQQILPDIAAAIDGYLQENNIPRASVRGIGIGVPGAVNNDGVVAGCDNLGWGIFNVAETFSKLTGFPVKAGNDASVAALGECWKGSGKGYQNMLFVTLGTGVGGGIVADGKILLGASGAAGEIGHMVINRDETETCGCGKTGCVEQYCSATGIVRLAKRYLAKCDTPSPLRSLETITCKDVFDLANTGDSAACEILEQAYGYMGEFIANICNVLNPQAVVIGGGVSKAGQPLLTGIRRHFDKYIYHASTDVTFALATLGNDAGAYGAVKMILD